MSVRPSNTPLGPKVPLRVWLLATRPQFFTVMILPILLGSAAAWHVEGVFSPMYLAMSLLAGVLCHAGVNVLNDYFDHHSGADDLNHTPLSPFAGGSRMIQNGLLSPNQMYVYGMGLLAAAAVLGIVLVVNTGLPLLVIGLLGLTSGYFYSSPPLALNGRGLGEALVGLNFGILAVLGAYYVQTQQLAPHALFAAVPLALLVTAILYINEFPDHDTDKLAGKNTLVVRLGKERARWVFFALVGAALLAIPVGVGLGLLPQLSMSALLAAPLAVKACRTLYTSYDMAQALVPGIKATILLHAAVGVMLTAAFVTG